MRAGFVEKERPMGQTPDRETAILLQNLSNTLFNALNDSVAAADLLARRLSQSDNPEELRYLAMLRHDQFRMLRVAENMSELAAIGLGEAVVDARVLDMNTLCADLCRTVAALVGEEKPAPEFVPGSGVVSVLGDSGKLEWMLLNILSNSLTHCGKEDSLRVVLSRRDDQVIITVEDSGSGIGDSVLPTVFEDYLREAELPEVGRGAGLGLSVAAGIAETHGGSLLVTAAPEGGTRVLVRLPANRSLQLREPRDHYGSGMRRILIALADNLSFEKYTPSFL